MGTKKKILTLGLNIVKELMMKIETEMNKLVIGANFPIMKLDLKGRSKAFNDCVIICFFLGIKCV